MIYCVSKRSDIVGTAWDWFCDKIDQSRVAVRNPKYPWHVSEYDLSAADGFRFITRDPRVAVSDGRLSQIVDRFPNTWEVGFCGYRGDMEIWRRHTEIPALIDSIKRLSEIVGKKRVTWVYGPVIFMDRRYRPSDHLKMFEAGLSELWPYVDRVRIDFLHVSEELHKEAPGLRGGHTFEREGFLRGAGEILHAFGAKGFTCRGWGDFSRWGVESGNCFSVDYFEYANDITLKRLKWHNDHTPVDCGCVECRDIGDMNFCSRKCTWCRCGLDKVEAARARSLHRDDALTLGVPVSVTDKVSTPKVRVYTKG